MKKKVLAFALGLLLVLLCLFLAEFFSFSIIKMRHEARLVALEAGKLARPTLDTDYGMFPPLPRGSATPWAKNFQAAIESEQECISRSRRTQELEAADPSKKCIEFDHSDWIFNGTYNRMAPLLNRPHSCYSENGDIQYDVSFQTDEHGRRLSTPEAKFPLKFMLFFGGSFVFGQGVEDSETLPSKMSSNFEDTKMYNYGVPGNGLGSTYAQVMSTKFPNEVSESSGTAIYFFFDFDVGRMIPTFNEGRSPSMRQQAMLELNHDGQIQVISPMRWDYRLLFWFYGLLDKSYTWEILNFDFPVANEQHLEVFASALQKISNKLKNEDHVKNFIVVSYPGNTTYFPKLSKLLEQKKIQYIDYSKWRLEELIPSRPYFRCDGHMTAAATEFFAKHLSQDLKNKLKLIEDRGL